MSLTPHGPGFSFLDSIEIAGAHAHGRKWLDPAAPYFADHFPGQPLMPGVLLIECAAQAAGALWQQPQAFLAGVQQFRFLQPVLPGQTVEIEVELEKDFGALAQFDIVLRVDETPVAAGKITLSRSLEGHAPSWPNAVANDADATKRVPPTASSQDASWRATLRRGRDPESASDATKRVPPTASSQDASWRATLRRGRDPKSASDATKRVPPQRKAPIHMPPVSAHNRSTIIFATICTANHKRILAHDDVHQLLLDCWRAADTWLVGRYVIMPDHIHFFCAPNRWPPVPLEKWVQFWKSHASRHWPRPEEQPVWHKSFWDSQLRRGQSYGNKWDYVRLNPVRQNLIERAEDWHFQGELNVLEWHD